MGALLSFAAEGLKGDPQKSQQKIDKLIKDHELEKKQ